MYLEQGDVLIHQEDVDFNNLQKIDSNTLALGEATGHHHSLYDGEFELFEQSKTKEKFLRVVTPVELRHQEHKPFIIPPGSYRIGIVKEYDHFLEETRNVVD